MYELLVDALVMPRRIQDFLPFIFASNAPFLLSQINRADPERKEEI